jgi:flavin reductase (DIM6/NTAB) family NADH-FMN oxidoreductase RutF
MPFDPMLFRQVLGRFATGVTVITTCKGDVKHGMTANAFSSVSLNPPLILVSVDKKADMHGYMMEADTFCVNILAEHRRQWSDWWAGRAPKDQDQFADIPHSTKVTGSPVLDDCLGYID